MKRLPVDLVSIRLLICDSYTRFVGDIGGLGDNRFSSANISRTENRERNIILHLNQNLIAQFTFKINIKLKKLHFI